ncbi:MAG TPA: DUF559 domain-containing protein [Lacunisphaera sp.]|nr:DUF559 domain-containing protein [Lacunisphaera sp.]
MKLPFDRALLKLARDLRNNSTLSETMLWPYLKGRQRSGYDFHRQKPIDCYIVDFFCPRLLLAVEIDGASHDLKGAKDEERQHRLEQLGIRFLRFEDRTVRSNPAAAAAAIDQWIEAHTPPFGHPSC